MRCTDRPYYRQFHAKNSNFYTCTVNSTQLSQIFMSEGTFRVPIFLITVYIILYTIIVTLASTICFFNGLYIYNGFQVCPQQPRVEFLSTYLQFEVFFVSSVVKLSVFLLHYSYYTRF